MTTNQGKQWTKREEEFLIKNSEMPLREVAERLGRSISSIKWKRQKLGLKREKINDLAGQRFERLLVIKDVGRIRRKVAWLCKCDCAKIVTVSSDHLRSGDTKSCGCYSRDASSERNSKDLTDQKFGNLRVIRQNGRTKSQQIKWLCECDCGIKTTVNSNHLQNGNTESCGCKRELNQRQGIAWEELINKFLKFKYNNYEYHKQLPNLKRPDFLVAEKKIILDAKRHDYLRIDECVEKYSHYCEKIIFICLEKIKDEKRQNFNKRIEVEFFYPEEFLEWLPVEVHAEFLREIKKIRELKLNENKEERNLDIQRAIFRLEKKVRMIKQETVAKEMGTGRNIFRERPELEKTLKDYNKEKEKAKNSLLLDIIERMAFKQLELEKKATQPGISRLIYENHLETVSKIFVTKKEMIIKKNFIINLTSRINSTKIYRDKIDQVIEEFNKKKKEKLIELIDKMVKDRGKVSKYDLWNNNREIFNRADVYKSEVDRLIKKSLEKKFQKSKKKKNSFQDLFRYYD